ncbi:MAG TPA: hypothetical protein VEB68_14305 [Croceibacterium sp.]|nr:hypothetical protein [Croceibacterium sp.]
MAKGNKGNLRSGKVKGGTRFPIYNLASCQQWSRKLVSKTHLNPQPRDVIFSGVVNSKGPTGEIKVSSLKQFDLIDGPSGAYVATSLAKKIAAAPDDELPLLLQSSALHPKVFSQIYDTFQGDTVTIAKLKQRAADLGVHPDKSQSCIDSYVASLAHAGLVEQSGENVSHKTNVADTEVIEKPKEELIVQDGGDSDALEVDENQEDLEQDSSARAIFHVNITLDASLDSEKLERQLRLLKKYRAI